MAAPRPFTWNRPDDRTTVKALIRELDKLLPLSITLSTPLRDFLVTRDAGDPSGYTWMPSAERDGASPAGGPPRVTVDFQGAEWEMTYLVISPEVLHASLTDPHDRKRYAEQNVQDDFNRLLTDGWRAVDPDGLLLATMAAGGALGKVLDSYEVPWTLVEPRLRETLPLAYRTLAMLTAMTMPPGPGREVAMRLADTWSVGGDSTDLLTVAKQVAASS